jgi:two-component system, OmpR family, phosphate regulon response regulator PhoB
MSTENRPGSVDREQRSVLLVEDDPELRRFVVTALRLDGYVVRVATDGDEAVVLATQARPDLVLLDLRLRRVDGWQVLAFFNADASLRTVPIVVLTASAGQSERARAWAAGAAEYLVKPISADQMLATVARILGDGEKRRDG